MGTGGSGSWVGREIGIVVGGVGQGLIFSWPMVELGEIDGAALIPV